MDYSAISKASKHTVTAGWQLTVGWSLFVFRIVMKESNIAGL